MGQPESKVSRLELMDAGFTELQMQSNFGYPDVYSFEKHIKGGDYILYSSYSGMFYHILKDCANRAFEIGPSLSDVDDYLKGVAI